jgi:hypothetical protein
MIISIFLGENLSNGLDMCASRRAPRSAYSRLMYDYYPGINTRLLYSGLRPGDRPPVEGLSTYLSTSTPSPAGRYLTTLLSLEIVGTSTVWNVKSQESRGKIVSTLATYSALAPWVRTVGRGGGVRACVGLNQQKRKSPAGCWCC